MKRNPTTNALTDIQEETARLYYALEAAGIGTWSFDPIAGTVAWDARCRELFGFVPDEDSPYKDILRHIHPDDRGRIESSVARALDPQLREIYDVQYRTTGGSEGRLRWLYCRGKAYFNEAGIAYRFSGTTQDITELILSREQMAASDQLAQMALNGANAGSFRILLDDDTIEYSPAFAHILSGNEKARLSRADFIRHIHPADRKLRKQAYAEAARTGRLNYTSRVVWDDGSVHTMRVSGTYVSDTNGRHYLFTGTAMDITAETEALAQRETFNKLVAASHDWMGIAGANGRLEFINTSGMALQGIDAGKAGNLLLQDVCTASSASFLRDDALPQLFAGGYWEGRIALKHFRNRKITIPVYLKLTLQKSHRGDGLQSIIAVARDLRGEEAALQAVRESETLFRNVTNSAPTGLWLSDEEGGLIYLNKTLIDWTGMPYKDLLGTGWAYAIIDEDRARSGEVFRAAVTARAHYDTQFRIKKGDGSVIWCRAAGDPYFDADGRYAGYAGFCMDINDQVAAANAYHESEARFRSIVEQAPMAIGMLRGRDMVISVGNDAIFRLWGKDASITGLPIVKALPELEGQPFIGLLEKVFDTGTPFFGNATHAQLEHNGVIKDAYFDFTYTPIRDDNGSVSGVMVLVTEVTDQVIARRHVEESEARFRALVEEAPVATCLFTGPDMKIEIANELMLGFWGKGRSAIGQPLVSAVPELSGQSFPAILEQVYTSGEPFAEKAAHAMLEVDGILRSFYFNYTYKPLKNAAGEVYGIIDMAVDVTAQVLDRQKLEDAESSLRSAIELAELATWNIDFLTNELTYSNRLRDWYGFTGDETVANTGYNPIQPADRERVNKGIALLLVPGAPANYNEEYTAIDYRTGKARIIHALGRMIYTSDGRPWKLSGTAQDVTEQRQIQLALEQQVRARTEELQAAYEELFDANRQLTHSNEELAQYAYVASHDLQEPLRKIRMFSGMLDNPDLPAAQRGLIGKISQSAERMTLLIRDLLDFSRLTKADALMQPVDLNATVTAVVNDFELAIEEKGARVSIDALPVVEGVALQMNQLFYNLLSNALKFTPPGRAPRITVAAQPAPAALLAAHIARPLPHHTYHYITFTDNGIGFEAKYAEQIFEVFKRLHGRDYYPGSGIGLALCRRIVANHHGYLYATSVQGEGTTFHMLLPGA